MSFFSSLHISCRVSEGNFTHPSLGTVLESLPSHGSSHLLFVDFITPITKAASFIGSFSISWSWTLNLAKYATPFAPSPYRDLTESIEYSNIGRHSVSGHTFGDKDIKNKVARRIFWLYILYPVLHPLQLNILQIRNLHIILHFLH